MTIREVGMQLTHNQTQQWRQPAAAGGGGGAPPVAEPQRVGVTGRKQRAVGLGGGGPGVLHERGHLGGRGKRAQEQMIDSVFD